MTEALKLRIFYRDMYQCLELPPVMPLRTTHKVPVTVQEDVEDTKMYPCTEMLDERKDAL